jgi:hypothetical protein
MWRSAEKRKMPPTNRKEAAALMSQPIRKREKNWRQEALDLLNLSNGGGGGAMLGMVGGSFTADWQPPESPPVGWMKMADRGSSIRVVGGPSGGRHEKSRPPATPLVVGLPLKKGAGGGGGGKVGGSGKAGGSAGRQEKISGRIVDLFVHNMLDLQVFLSFWIPC